MDYKKKCIDLIDEKLKELESRGYGEHTEQIQEGISMTYYNSSPLDQILNIGRAIEARKRIEKSQEKKLTYVQELESKKKIEGIIKKLEEDFGPRDSSEEYLNLSQGE